MQRWVRLVTTAVLAAALLLAGCGGSGSDGGTAAPGGDGTKRIVVGLQAEPVTLDPHQVTDYNSNRAAQGIFDRLIEFKDESTELEPGLAERWEVSDDGLVYRFYLREGVTFHDGTPFNADAVKFSIDRQIDADHPYHDTGEFAYAEFTFGKVREVRVIDDYTVETELAEPYAPLQAHIAEPAAPVAHPAAVVMFGRDFSKNPVGTGPFRFVDWQPGVEVVLAKNEDYWDGAPKVDQVIYRPVIEDQARLTEFEAGGLDFIVNIPPDELARLKESGEYTVLEQAGMHVWYLVFNADKEPFNKKEVRQAVNY